MKIYFDEFEGMYICITSEGVQEKGFSHMDALQNVLVTLELLADIPF